MFVVKKSHIILRKQNICGFRWSRAFALQLPKKIIQINKYNHTPKIIFVQNEGNQKLIEALITIISISTLCNRAKKQQQETQHFVL